MSVTEIENELRRMTNSERLVVIELATRLMRDELGESSDSRAEKRRKLRASAQLMFPEYLHDKELTALTSLDGEAFEDA